MIWVTYGGGTNRGGMIWVTYGGGTNRGGHDFDPKDYGEDKMWVVLTPPMKSSKTK